MGKEIYRIKDKKGIVIIVDGCDCSGKSFLVHSLGKAFPGITIKLTRRPVKKDKEEIGQYKSYVYSILDYINHNRQTKNIILDRFFSSELVYSKVKRKYEAFDDGAYIRMEKSILPLPHLYVYCNPKTGVIVDRLRSRGDDYIVESDVKELVARYNRFFRLTKMNKIKLDTSKPVEELVEQIRNKIK